MSIYEVDRYTKAAAVLDEAAELLTNDRWCQFTRSKGDRMCAVGAICYADQRNPHRDTVVTDLARRVASDFIGTTKDMTLLRDVDGVRQHDIMYYNDHLANSAWRVRRALRGAAGRARKLARQAARV